MELPGRRELNLIRANTTPGRDMMTLMSFKLETYELYSNERTNLPYKLQTAYYRTTYTQCVWLAVRFTTLSLILRCAAYL